MKSIFVTLMSALLLYGGYIYHPVVNRIGNDISARLQKEFTPANRQLTMAQKAISEKPVSSTYEAKDKTMVTTEGKEVGSEEPVAPEKKSEPEEQPKPGKKPIPTPTINHSENAEKPANNPEKSGSDQVKKDKHPKPKYFPYRNPTKKPQSRTNPSYQKPKKIEVKNLPPEYSLISAIKYNIDVANHPEKYAITARDKRLGERLQQLKEKFNKKYNAKHLTVKEIKQLKEEYEEEFLKIAKEFMMTKEQLTIFDSVFFNK